MNSKTSFFNKDIFRADIKRFWWISVSYLFLFLITGVFILYTEKSFGGYYFMSVIAGLTATVLPTILFSYLDHAGSVTCIHAFPIKRREHYLTHLLFAFLSIAIPTLICYIIAAVKLDTLLTTEKNLHFVQTYLIHNMFIIMGLSAGTLGCMLSGNPISSLMFSGLIAGFPFYSEAIIRGFIDMNVYGINSLLSDSWFLEFSFEEISAYTLILFAITVGLLFASWLMYKKRALEKNGDILVFDVLKPVFVGIIALLAGFLGYFYICGLFDLEPWAVNSIFIMLPFGFIGIIVSNMLAKRAFTLKGIAKPCLFYTLGVIFLFAIFKFDIFCYERHLPKLDDVEYVTLTNEADADRYYWSYGEKYLLSDPLKPEELRFTSKEDIQNVINLHKFCFENKTNDGSESYPICYKLKNGKYLKRHYTVDFEKYREVLKPVLETPQMRMEKYQFIRDYKYKITGIALRDFRIRTNTSDSIYKKDSAIEADSHTITDEAEINSLIAALKKDIENSDYDTIYRYNSTATMIDIDMTRPMTAENDKSKTSEIGDMITVGVPYTFTNTINWLKDYGFYDNIVTADKVDYIKISTGIDIMTITDTNEVNAMYDYICYNKRSELSEKISDSIKDKIGTAWHSYDFYDFDNTLLFSSSK